MIDHQIDWHQRLDDSGIATDAFHRAAHRGQINHQRHAGEILQNDPRNHKRDLFVGRFFRVPTRQSLDVFAAHFFAIAIPQH